MDVIKKKTPILDPIDKYTYWFIPKFISLFKETGLILEWLFKMIIRYRITEQEKVVFIEILYNKEAVLAWDFTEIRRIKNK